MNLVMSQTRFKKDRLQFLSVDLSKAFDSVYRAKMFDILEQRAKTPLDKHMLEMINNLYTDQSMYIGEYKIKPTQGVQ
jgi:hypothetical protein